MLKERKIILMLSLALLCCGSLCLCNYRSKARVDVANPLDAARSLARNINDAQSQARVLGDIGIRYAEAGDFKRSVETIDEIDSSFWHSEPGKGYPPAWYQAEALSKVAFLSVQGKQPGLAKQLLARAVRTAETIDESHTQEDALYQVACHSAKAGEFDQAIEIARGMKDGFFQPLALAEIADNCKTREQLEKLVKTVDAVPIPYNKVRTFIRLAGQGVKRNESGHAAAMLERAAESLLPIMDDSNTGFLLAQIAEQYALAGLKGRAREIFIQAIDHTESVSDLSEKSLEMSELVILLARTGEIEQALKLSDRMDKGDDQDRALIKVVALLADAGRQSEALEVAQRIYEPYNKDSALEKAVEALASRQQYQKALQLAESISSGFDRSKALQQVALACTRTGDFDQALRIALRISEEWVQFGTLEKLVPAMAAAGKAEQAFKTAQSIGNTLYRTRILIRLANHYAEAGDPSRVAEIIDPVLREITLIQNQTDQVDLLAAAGTLWSKAGIELTDSRKIILNKLATGK